MPSLVFKEAFSALQKQITHFVRSSAYVALILLLPQTGLAALGGDADSIAADQAKLRATRKVETRSGYTVHEMTRDDGTSIKEYISPAGKVFGVSWQGPSRPDLSQLLGQYFHEFQSKVRPAPGRRHAAAVNNDLVVQSSGSSRTFSGRAYVNSMLPAGVTPQEIQ